MTEFYLVKIQKNNRISILLNGFLLFIGSTHLYIFVNPKEADGSEKKFTYEMAQAEIAEAKGFKLRNTSLTKGD